MGAAGDLAALREAFGGVVVGPGDAGYDAARVVQGGAIARVPDDATAFSGRSGSAWIGAEVFWEDPADDDASIS